jgi:hypothetical protein
MRQYLILTISPRQPHFISDVGCFLVQFNENLASDWRLLSSGTVK